MVLDRQSKVEEEGVWRRVLEGLSGRLVQVLAILIWKSSFSIVLLQVLTFFFFFCFRLQGARCPSCLLEEMVSYWSLLHWGQLNLEDEVQSAIFRQRNQPFLYFVYAAIAVLQNQPKLSLHQTIDTVWGKRLWNSPHF